VEAGDQPERIVRDGIGSCVSPTQCLAEPPRYHTSHHMYRYLRKVTQSRFAILVSSRLATSHIDRIVPPARATPSCPTGTCSIQHHGIIRQLGSFIYAKIGFQLDHVTRPI
jgi:hypothetical protein